MKKIFGKLIFPLLIFVIIEIFFLGDTWQQLEKKAINMLFQIRGEKPVSDEILIVAIDNDTFSTLDTNWPFPRDYYAHIIENLEEAGAKLIVFDVLFTENTNPESDSLLAEMAAKYGNVVFSGKLNKQGDELYSSSQIIKPIKKITEKQIPWGLVNITYDSDSFVRNYNLYQTHNKKKYFPLGIVALSHLDQSSVLGWESRIKVNANEIKAGKFTIPRIFKNSLMINFYGPKQTFQTVSFGNVIDDADFEVTTFDIDAFEEEKKTGKFKDKIVMIGSTAEDLHDNFPTPFFQNGQLTPGVEIHANFLEMVVQNNFLKHFHYIYILILHLFILILIYTLNSIIKPNISFFLNIILVAGSIYFSYYLFSQQNILMPVFEIPLILVTIYVVTLISHYIKTAQERKMIKKTFQHYMAAELVDVLLENPNKLKYGGTEQNITVLFSDICSFTTYTENHTPQQTVALLREYLTAMVKVIIDYGGTVDKFVGDEIMAVFGSPVQYKDHAARACKAALAMRKELKDLQKDWAKRNIEPFDMGVGINTGDAIVGNLGSEQIFDYTAIGDNINLGARLEPLTRNYDTQNNIIISEYTYEKAKDKIEAEYLDEVKVKGKDISVKIYQVIGERSDKNE